jgi:endonuclease-3
MKSSTAAVVVDRLEAQYGRAQVTDRSDPVEELVACILSQHTSDANSVPAFERLHAKYPDWQDMVDAGEAKVADVIRAAGLANQKAKSIISCLKEIKTRMGEYSLEHLRTMPMIEARDWLTSLPGVGPKTASIVLCFSLGMESIPVDTHVYRVAWRIGLIGEKTNAVQAHDELLKVVPPGLAFRFHMALIEHGRQVCKAPTPLCEKCVVTDLCRWFWQGGPAKTKKMRKQVA